MGRRLIVTLALTACLLIGLPGIAGAQSGSYVETIYQATDSAFAQPGDSTGHDYGSSTGSTFTDTPGQIVDPDQVASGTAAAEQKIQSVIDSLIRILSAKVAGVQLNIKVINCAKIVPPTGTGTGTGTGVDPIQAKKSEINEKYGIEIADGVGATWTEGQLNAAEEVFAIMPAGYMSHTEKVVRDEKGPPGSPETARGYVQPPNLVVHMLNPATVISDDLYQQLKDFYGRDPTEAEQLYQIKKGFQKTLVHEMAHCFHIANPVKFNAWKSLVWPNGVIKGTSVSSYGSTMAEEDFAECCAYYVLGGRIVGDYFVASNGGKIDMERYNFIKDNVMSGKQYLNN